MERQGEVQENFDHHNAWELDSRLERAMDALRCPPADANVENLSVAKTPRGSVALQEPDVYLTNPLTTLMQNRCFG
jgi:ATPase subunit of ABC transporter with duplicated ATPase domains